MCPINRIKWLLVAVVVVGALSIYSQLNISTARMVAWSKQRMSFQSTSQVIDKPSKIQKQNAMFVFGSYADRRFYNASAKQSQLSASSIVVRLLVLRRCQLNSDTVDGVPPLLLTTATGQQVRYENWTYVNLYNNRCTKLYAPHSSLHGLYIQTTVPLKDYQSSKGMWLSSLPLHPHPVQLPNNASLLPHSLAVCVPPLYLFADVALLTAFLHVWTQLGATSFIVYHVGKNKASVSLSFVIWWFGHLLARNDCVQRTVSLAQYVAQVDLDEYMLPTRTTSLPDLVRSQFAQHPSAAGLQFKHHTVYFNGTLRFGPTNDVQDLCWLRQVKCARSASPKHNPKIIIRPQLVSVMGTHSVTHSLSAQRQAAMPVSLAALYHVRISHELSACRARSNPCVPCRVFDRFIPSTPPVNDVQLATPNLTPDAVYARVYARIALCLTDAKWRAVGCKVPHEQCVQVLQDNSIHWSIVNTTRFVTVAPGLHMLPKNFTE